MDPREELDHLRKVKRLKELEARAGTVAEGTSMPQQPTEAAPIAPESSPSLLSRAKDASDMVMKMSPLGASQMVMDKAIKPAFNKVGEMATEFMGKHQVNPNASAFIGTGIQMIPDIGMALTSPVKEAAASLPNTPGLKTLLAKSVKEAGADIGKAESKLGLGIDKAPKAPRTSAGIADLGETFKKLSDMGASKIRDVMDPKGMQELKKQAEVVLDLMDRRGVGDKFSRAFISKGKAALDTALKEVHPELKQAGEAYKAAKNKEEILAKLGGVAKNVGKAGLTAAGLGAGYSMIRNLGKE